MQCDKDQYAPFDGMNVCAECKDGYAPIQGSVRCFAGFGGRVLVTEGKSVGTANKIYDPNGSVFKIYGDDSSAVTGAEGAIIPAGFTYTTDENTDDGVPAMGGPLDGESSCAWLVGGLAVERMHAHAPSHLYCVLLMYTPWCSACDCRLGTHA